MVKRKDGLYQEAVPIKVDGRTKYKYFYGRKKADVLRKIADWRAEQEEAQKGRRFQVVAEDWWESAQKDLAANTIHGYRAHYNRLLAHFGDIRITEIRPADISRYMREYVKTSHPADKTARTELSIIAMICKHAIRRQSCP